MVMNLIGSPRPGLKKNLKNWPAAALNFLQQRPTGACQLS
jgi:hypothetical protein